jgi:two-component system, OmpR family, phosphate regulon sensor histidine kinase PhoR
MAEVDPEKINRIFLNLISNSIKFTPQNGEIKITLEEKNDLLEWQIMDSGPGIKEESKESIFERFYNSDQLYNERFKGTGLRFNNHKRICGAA